MRAKMYTKGFVDLLECPVYVEGWEAVDLDIPPHLSAEVAAITMSTRGGACRSLLAPPPLPPYLAATLTAYWSQM